LVRFWDTSSIVPLLVSQAASPAVEAELERDQDLVVWWATRVECTSALARLEREGGVGPRNLVDATARLAVLADAWMEVQPQERVRRTAERLLRVHPLRAADAFQLAAAIVAADDDPRFLPLVTLDDRLARAAEREGFPVVEPA
jgi:uncharacterized protein